MRGRGQRKGRQAGGQERQRRKEMKVQRQAPKTARGQMQMQMHTDRQTRARRHTQGGRARETETQSDRPTARRKAGDGQGTGDGIPSETDTLAQTVTQRRERPVRKGGGVSLGPGEPRLDALPWGWQSPVGTPRLPRSRGLKGPLRLGSLRRDPAPAPRPEGECGRECACECVGGRRWGRVDWGGPGGYPQWRGEGVAAGALEACAVLLLSLSLPLSPSPLLVVSGS